MANYALDPKAVYPVLLRLPAETLVSIMQRFDMRTIMACQLTCKHLNTIINGSSALQYILTLAGCGMSASRIHSLGTASERLERLQMHEDRWLNLSWVDTLHIRLSSSERLENPGGLIIISHIGSTPPRLTMRQVASFLRSTSERSWEVTIPVPSEPFSYLFDVDCDLIVAQQFGTPKSSYLFYRLSDGQPHTHAAKSALEGDVPVVGQLIHGPYFLAPGRNNLHTLWQWESGEEVTKINAYYFSVAFLDRRHIVITSLDWVEGTVVLLVYRLPCTISDAEGHFAPPLVVFGLPTFPDGRPMQACHVKSGFCHSYSTSQIQTRQDFAVDQSYMLLSISFTELHTAERYELLVPGRTLLARLPPDGAVAPLDNHPFFPWEDWGPDYTHMSRQPHPPPTVAWRDFCLFGMRRIRLYPVRRDDGVLVAVVWDYHPFRVARAERMPPDGARTWEVVHGETVDEVWAFGDDELMTTRLAYVRTEMPLPEKLQAFEEKDITMCLNEDSIVACTNYVGGRARDLYVFTF